jgi:hypothetical protein
MVTKKSFVCIFIFIIIISSCSYVAQCESSTRQIYFTDFESVTKKNSYSLDMGIENYFVLDGSTGDTFIDDGSMRDNSPVPHSGKKSVCLEVTNGYRNEFNLMNMQNLVDKELFISVWLYLPSDFKMHMNNGNWFEIVNPVMTADTFVPYFALHINQHNEKTEFGLQLYHRDVNQEALVIKQIPDVDLPRGRWFNLQYYVYHDDRNGIIKIWFDDPTMEKQPIINIEGLDMYSPTTEDWYTTIAKIYHDPQDTYSKYRLWVDDLEIWNGLPPERLNVNVWTDKGENNQLSTSWGCLGSYKKSDTATIHYSLNKECQGKLFVVDSEGSIKTLLNGPILQGKHSLNLLINGPTGYWQLDCTVSTDQESSGDFFQFCVVQDYVKFKGELITSSYSATTGNFYQIKVLDVISDPTGKISVDKHIQVHWNHSLSFIDGALENGDYVEIYGGYVPSSIGSYSEAVILANSDEYIRRFETQIVSIDPNGGSIYVDYSEKPIKDRSTYDWLNGSEHRLYAEPAFESSEGKFVFSRWSDGNIENPRNIRVNDSRDYIALWKPANVPVSVSVLSPSNVTVSTGEVALILNVDAPTKWLSYSLDGTNNITISGNHTIQILTEGTHNLIVYAEDYFGNVVKSVNTYFTIKADNNSGYIVIITIVVIVAVVVVTALLGFKKFYRNKNCA